MLRRYLILILLVVLSGCASHQITLNQGAEKVRIAKSDPLDNFEPIGPVSGINGNGCGLFGYIGTYDRAILDLQNKTYAMGGSYAQIFTITEPHLRGDCFDNVYKINATAYKKVRSEPSPIPIVEKTNEEEFTKKIRELKKLLDEEIITKEEFESQKKKLLDKGI